MLLYSQDIYNLLCIMTLCKTNFLSLHFQNRLNVFLELLEQGELDKVTVDVDKSDKLIRLLDTVVIKLEGGTEEDLKALDNPAPAENNNDKLGKIIYFFIVPACIINCACITIIQIYMMNILLFFFSNNMYLC